MRFGIGVGGKIPNRPPAGKRRRAFGRASLAGAVVGLLLLVGAAGLGGPLATPGQEAPPAEEAARVPVLLVPGWNDDAASLAPLRDRFVEAGWEAHRVLAMEFADPVGSNDDHAREIARAVESLRAVTGAETVDVVAHSMGGLALRHYLQFLDGAGAVRRAVFLGTPHRGTVLAILAWGDGGREMVPGSDFLQRLNQDPGLPEGVEALSLRTPLDLRLVPALSAHLPGALNVEVCCPTHPGMVDDENTFKAVERFLSRGGVVADPFLPWWEEVLEGIREGR